jgi:hypothetical protein
MLTLSRMGLLFRIIHPGAALFSAVIAVLLATGIQREAIDGARRASASPYVLVSERGAPLSVAGYQPMVARTGEAARFSLSPHASAQLRLQARE